MSDPYTPYAHRFGYILQNLLTNIIESNFDLAANLPVRVVGDADVARLGDSFKAGCDVYTITENVVVVDDDIANVNAYAEFDPEFLRHAVIPFGHLPLEFLLTGLLFDDAGYRMVPTHATKAGVRYRYYVSLPHLHGESKTASVGSVSRIPATEIEDVIVKSLREYRIAQKEKPSSGSMQVGDRKMVQDSIACIDVHADHLAIRLRSADGEEISDPTDDQQLSIPWQRPPSRRSRQILLPRGIPSDEVRPTRIERRARLVSAIARGRRWLDEIVSGSVTDVQQTRHVRNAACVRST